MSAFPRRILTLVRSNRNAGFYLSLTLALITAGLVAYSVTAAFAWDEGFHILAAQLILRGKKPYIDFVFSQTPLNAYWNAAWMALLGENWRVPHAMAALCSSTSVILSAALVYKRFPIVAWRFPAALMVAAMVGLNVLVVRFGGISQAYGLCLLTLVGAAWFATLIPSRQTTMQSALAAMLAGLLCGIAAGSSLLNAPAGPVLLLWILICGQRSRRLATGGAFALGEALGLSPIFWLFAQGPRQVYFGIVDYNLLFRQSDWPHANRQNFEVIISWIDSGPALLMILLAVGGLLFIRYRADWTPAQKAEFYLYAWLSAGMGIYIATAVRPTFERYFIFVVPFMSMLAVVGLFAAASLLYRADRPWIPTTGIILLTVIGLGRTLYLERSAMSWADLEETARKVSEVSQLSQPLFADEAIYFLTKHTPPSGMEMRNAHKFNFPPATVSLFHLIPQAELDRKVREGYFPVLETCEDDDVIAEHGYSQGWVHKAEAGECNLFWDRK